MFFFFFFLCVNKYEIGPRMFVAVVVVVVMIKKPFRASLCIQKA